MEPKSESKYERLRKIGIGSYGVVFKCVNRQTGQVVAIKRYSENDSDPIIRKIAMREVRMLRQLKHPNLINLIEVFRRKRRLHLVFDYCELTVLDVIEKYGQNCPLNLIRKIVWQTVNGILYCHSRNCIHRDIKPENILINQSGVVKLCDFGFARAINPKPLSMNMSVGKGMFSSSTIGQFQMKRNAQILGSNGEIDSVNDENRKQPKSATDFSSDRQALTEYVATRWYRAPELLIGEVYYDTKIDIWAIGCVTAELMRGEPIWPGKTDFDQLCIIKSSLGQLTSSQTHTLITQAIYDQASIERLINQSASAASDSLDRKLPARVGQGGIDFVLLCLQMDPAKRPTSDQLLGHHYIHSARMAQFMRESAYEDRALLGRHLSAAPNAVTLTPALTGQQNLEQSHRNRHRSNSQSVLLATKTAGKGNAIGSPISLMMAPKPIKRRQVVAGSRKNSQPISPNFRSKLPTLSMAMTPSNPPSQQQRQQVVAELDPVEPSKRSNKLTGNNSNNSNSNDAKRKLPTNSSSMVEVAAGSSKVKAGPTLASQQQQQQQQQVAAPEHKSLVPIAKIRNEPKLVSPAELANKESVARQTNHYHQLQQQKQQWERKGRQKSPTAGEQMSKRYSQSNGNLLRLAPNKLDDDDDDLRNKSSTSTLLSANGGASTGSSIGSDNNTSNQLSSKTLRLDATIIGRSGRAAEANGGELKVIGQPDGTGKQVEVDSNEAGKRIQTNVNSSASSGQSDSFAGTVRSSSISFLPSVIRNSQLVNPEHAGRR